MSGGLRIGLRGAPFDGLRVGPHIRQLKAKRRSSSAFRRVSRPSGVLGTRSLGLDTPSASLRATQHDTARRIEGDTLT